MKRQTARLGFVVRNADHCMNPNSPGTGCRRICVGEYLWSAKMKYHRVFMRRFFPVCTRDEGRRVPELLRRDGHLQCDAGWLKVRSSEKLAPAFPARDSSEAVPGCNGLSMILGLGECAFHRTES